MVTGTSLFNLDSWFYAACAATDVGFVGFGRIDAGVYAFKKGLNFRHFLSLFPGFYLSVFRGDGAYSRPKLRC